VRPALLDDPSRGLDHRHDGRLVVAPRIVPPALRTMSVLADRLERPLRRHRVEVRAEEDRRPALARPGRRQSRFPIVESISRPASSSVHVEPSDAARAITRSRDRSLLAGGLGDRGQLGEEVEHAPSSAALERPNGFRT
jgi:hypothetical protein